MRIISAAGVIILLSTSTFAHPGRTDSKGGHTNRKTGEYHIHGSGSSPPTVRTEPRTSIRTDVDAIPRLYARPATEDTQTVYVTKTGTKYHLASCRHLKSKIPIVLAEAVARYSPCSVCRPPTAIAEEKPTEATEKLVDDPKSLVDREKIKADIEREKQQKRETEEQRKVAAEQAAAEKAAQEEVAREKAAKEEAARREMAAASKVRIAKQLLDQNKSGGKRRLQEVVKDHPETTAAKEAAELLKLIP